MEDSIDKQLFTLFFGERATESLGGLRNICKAQSIEYGLNNLFLWLERGLPDKFIWVNWD